MEKVPFRCGARVVRIGEVLPSLISPVQYEKERGWREEDEPRFDSETNIMNQRSPSNEQNILR